MLKRISTVVAGAFFALSVLYMPHSAQTTSAQVSTDTVQKQYMTTQEEFIEALTEYVKLLQLLTIQKLETRIAILQSQIEARK